MPDSEVRRRVLARRLCSQCGLDYNLIASATQVENACDACGGELVSRPDDTEEALSLRLVDYAEKTRPVLDIFRRKEYVATIDATQDPRTVQQAIRDRFQLPRLKEAAEAIAEVAERADRAAGAIIDRDQSSPAVAR